MRKFLTFLLSIFIISTILFGCKTSKVVESGEIVSGYMLNTYSKVFTAVQFDSICFVDKLSNDFNDWHRSSFIDYESGKRIVMYMFIKEFTEVSEVIYIVSPEGADYKVTRRIVENE